MSRKRYSAEQIITKLREAEILSSRGMKVAEICRQIGVAENILSMEERVRRIRDRSGEEAKAVGEGERQAEEAGCRASA